MSEVAEKPKSYTQHLEQLAKAHGIKPLKGSETVTYVPVNIRVDPDTGRTLIPKSTQINNDTVIINQKTGEAESLVYVESERPVKTADGGIRIDEVRPLIFIEGGARTLGAKDKNLYFVMELSDENDSKIGRDSKVRAKFRRLDADKTAENNIELEEMKAYAITLIKDMPLDDLRVAAEKFKVDTNRGEKAIRWDLMIKAKEDIRHFIRESSDVQGKARLLIKDAIELRVLEYDGIDRKYSLLTGEDKKEVLQIEVGHDAEKTMVEFLLSHKEGQKLHKTLKSRVSI